MKLIEEHYSMHYLRLLKTAQSKGLSFYLAEEAVQETYTQAMEKYHDDIRDFNKWLQQILNNVIKDIHRQERNRGMTYVPRNSGEIFVDITEAYNETNDR